MKQYRKRKIDFYQTVHINNWKIKVHIITYLQQFDSQNVLEAALSNLPSWIDNISKANLPMHNIGSLIVHEGRDGVWSVLSCWVDENMLRTVTFFTPFNNREVFRPLGEQGSMACVWELAVICHERRSWVEHILQKPHNPSYDDYFNDTLTTEL